MTTEDQPPTTLDKLDLLVQDLGKHMEEGRLLSARAKALQKDISKGKNMRKKKPPSDDSPKRLSALQKPVQISDELNVFLGFEKSSLHARQEVTTTLNKYIKDNELQNPKNRRYILLEGSPSADALRVLLKNPDQEVTFFNIQRYLKPHYPPSEKEKKALLNSEQAVPEQVVPEKTEIVKDLGVVEETGEKKEVQKTPKKTSTKRTPRA